MAASPEKQNRLIKVEIGSSTKTADALPRRDQLIPAQQPAHN